MSNVIATIKTLTGQVEAISAEGVRRQLSEGDHLYQGEQLVTGPTGSVSLTLTAEGQALIAGADAITALEFGPSASWGGIESLPASGAGRSAQSSEDAASNETAEQEPQEEPTPQEPVTVVANNDGNSHVILGSPEYSWDYILSETAGRLAPIIGYPTGPIGFANDTRSLEFAGNRAGTPAKNNIVIAANDRYTLDEDGAIKLDLLGNDVAADGGLKIISINGVTLTGGAQSIAVPNGTVLVAADGSLSFTPDPNFHGDVSFDYLVEDGDGDTDTATVSIIVNPLADLVAADDLATTAEDVPIINSTVTSNDSTTSGGNLNYAVNTGVSNGTLIFNIDGSYTYTPDPGYNGEDSFTYTVTDAAAGESLTQTVYLTITPVNDPPVIGGGGPPPAPPLPLFETDNPLSDSGSLLITDVDTGDTPTASHTATDITAFGITLTPQQITDITNGFSIDPDGHWTFNLASPDYLAEGDEVSASFTVTVTDDSGATASIDILVTIVGTNDAPVITSSITEAQGTVIEAGNADDGSALIGDPAASGTLTATDIDTADVLTWSLIGAQPTTYGNLVLNPTTGAWTYTLNNSLPATQALKEGESVTQTYTARVTDDFGAYVDQTITITINGSNDVPVITNDVTQLAGSVTEAATGVTGTATASGTLTASDVDADATQTWSLQGIPSTTYGSMALNASTGVWTFSLDNSLPATQELKNGDSVTQTYIARVTDDFGAWVEQTITISITGSDDLVTVTGPDTNGILPGDLSVREDLTITGSFSISAADGLDPSAALTIAGTAVSKAALEGSGTTPVAITTTQGVLTLTGYNPTTGVVSYSYDPSGLAKDHSGGDVLDAISIVVKDANGDTASGTRTINILDTAPLANPDSNAVSEDTAPNPVSGNLVSSGAGTDSLGTDATAVTGIIAGTGIPGSNVTAGTTSATGTSIAGSYGTLVQGADGSYSYTLDNSNPAVQALNAGETTTDTFTYTITDADGDISSTTLTITLTGSNDLVTVTVPDTNGSTLGDLSVREDLTSTGSFSISALDGLDPSAALTIAGTAVSKAALEGSGTTPVTITTSQGVLTLTGYNPTTGVVSFSYDPNGLAKDHTGGDVLDAISIVVKDDNGDTAGSTLSINILDTAPLANPDSNAVSEDTAPNPVSGNLISSGAGTDTLGTDATAVTGIIAGLGIPGSNVTAGTTSANGTSIAGNYGTLVQGADGSYRYTLDNSNPAVQALNAGETTTDTFTYTITDADGDLSSTTLTVTINGTNDVPAVTNLPAATVGAVTEAGHLDNGTAVAGTPSVSGTLTASDVDADATQTWAVQGTPGSTYGSFAFDSGTRVWTYTLDDNLPATQALKEGQSVTQTCVIRVTDDFGAYVDQTITVTINGTNDVPVITNLPAATVGAVTEAGHLDNGTAVAGTPSASGTLTASDVDSSATQTWSLQGTPSTTYGSISLDSTSGVWTYTLNNSLAATQALKEGDSVTQTYTARVTDDFGAYVDQTLTVTINGTNDVPVVTNLPAATVGAVTEAGHLDNGTAVAGTPSASGTLTASDVDSSATQVWSLQGTPSTTYGSISLDSTSGVWTYTLNNSLPATQALKEGDSVTQTYTARVTDDFGAFADQTITVTINGTNDVPVITNLPAATVGAVTEAGHLDNGTAVAGTPSATGDLNASDVDADATQNWSLQGTPSTTYGSMVLNSSTGIWTYTLNNSLAATQALKEGDSVTQTYTARVTDDFGAYVDQTITVTITGSNDVPVVTNLPAATVGAVTEAGHLDDGTAVAGTPSASGTLTASDVDSSATQTWSLQGTPSATYGNLVLNSSTGIWTYTLNNSLPATQALKEGDSVTQTYTARVTDDFGAYVDQTLTITINGTNDVPVITNLPAATAGAVTEAGHLDNGTAVAGTPSASGTLTASDVDASATQTWSLQGTPSTTYGNMVLNSGTGIWTYTLNNSLAATQALKEGDSVTQTYTARVTDDFGAYVDQTLTVTITGSNDVPLVTNLPAATVGAVTEAGHLDNGTDVAGTPSASGTLTASDVDADATQTWTVQGTPGSTYGSFAFDSGTKIWTYSLDNNLPATQALKEGQSVTQTCVIRVTDDFGAFVDQTITVTINGTNDVPVVTNLPAATVGAVTEAGHLDNGTAVAGTPSATGDLNASDVDASATQTWSLQGTQPTTYGNMALNSSTGIWTYTLNNSLPATQALKEGDSVTQTYTARVTDDFGAFVDQTITVTITGTNDVPAVTNLPAATVGAVTEAGHLDNGTAVAGTPSASGTLTASDVDADATQTWTVQGTPGSTYGSFAFDSGTRVWTYSLDNNLPATQALKEGQSVTQTCVIRVTDDFGAYVDQTITVTINGTNDVPVITNLPAATVGAVTEAGHLDNGTAVAGTPSATGDLNASDVDADATQTWSLQGTPSTTYGNLVLNSSTGIWTYTLNNSLAATQALKEGDSVTQTYTARVTDDFGAYVDQTLTITITGTNDVPVAVADTTAVTEDAADQSGFNDSNAATTIVAGNVLTNDTDVDTGDKATLSVIGVAPGTPGSASGNVASSVAGTYGSVSIAADGSYTYTLDNSKPTVQALASGQSVTDTFTYTITDSQGATSSTTLIVTVNGANDRPDITVGSGDSASASLLETNSALAISGTLSIADIDTTNTVAASIRSVAVDGSSTYSGLPPTNAQLLAMFTVGGGNVLSNTQQSNPNGIAWSFNSGTQFFDFLPAGQTLILNYVIRARDSSGVTATRDDNQTVQITITGTNDAGTIVADVISGPETGAITGNVLTNDIVDPDNNEALSVSAATLDTNGDGSQDVYVLGSTIDITSLSGGTLGSFTMSSTGAYSFTPKDANYSGAVPVITYTAGNATFSDSKTLTITVNPVSDAPGVTADAPNTSTPEDTPVALGFNAPTVNDATDQNGPAVAGDNPERLGLITLNGIPAGAQLLDGTSGNAVLHTAAGGAITILLSDATNLISSPGAATLTMTTAQFEALRLLPVANSGSNLSVSMSTTSYEVDNAGVQISGVAGATTTTTVAVEVLAVTDSVDLKINGTDGAYDATITEDNALDLTALLSASFQDLDGSEQRAIIISNPLGNGTILVNGSAVAAGASITIAHSAAGNTLETSQSGFPAISIRPAGNFSGDLNGITVTLSAKDTDSDSTVTTLTQTDSVTLNLHVNPLAGDVTVSAATTPEDTGVRFLNGLSLTDTDGSESITGITVNPLPAGWVIRDDSGSVVFTSTGANSYSVPAGEVSNGDFRNYTITPPAHSSADISVSLSVTTTDTQTVNGAPVSDTRTTTLNQAISVTAVAERVGSDSDGDGSADLSINPSFNYSSAGAEDQWFVLNQDGFDLKAGWNNQDADGSEQTFALLTPVLASESPLGSQFRYTDGSVTTTLTYTGTPLSIPMAALSTVEFLAPPNVSGAFHIQVQALTIDTDPNGGAPVQTISGSATLSNVVIAPVADAVTLAVDAPAAGLEDTSIALNIRPTSADPSETFNVTISQIPAGSVLTYGGIAQTISAGSVSITNFSSAVALSITPPLNSNVDFTLNVSGVSVDTSNGITSTSAPVSLNLEVDLRGVADSVTVNRQTLQTSEATVEGNAQHIALSGAITSVVPFDNDGSETVSLVMTGIPSGINVQGLTFIGGVGANRAWSGTPAEFASANLVVTQANFSGTIDFLIRAVSTENDGNSLTGPTQAVRIEVAPSPEATLSGQTALQEDVRTKLDFSIQTPDNNESLQSLWIKADEVESQPFQLFLGTTPLGSALVADAGWYKLTAAQAGNIFAQGAANSDADFSFAIKYEIRDLSSDGTLAATVTQSDATHALNVTPVTDPTTSSNDFIDRIISASETVTVNVTVTQNDDSNASNAKDADGSERLLYFIIDNVPAGVSVVGGTYIGNSDGLTQGQRNTGRWKVDISDTPFNSAALVQSFEFALDGSSLQLSDLDEIISITAYTQDSGGAILTSSTNWHLQTSNGFDDSMKPPTDPAIIDKWVPETTIQVIEDAPLTLAQYVDAQISGSSAFAITITGLSAGTQISGMTQEVVNGNVVWTVQGDGGNAALQAALNGIIITPPQHSNSNNSPGGFSFTTTLTTYDVGGGRHDESVTFNQVAEPITDPMGLSISAPDVDENTPATITLNLNNPADGSFSNVIDGKVYISLDESGLSATGGTLSFGGSPLTAQAVSGVSGVPNGSYFVLTGVTSTANLTLVYQPPANAKGDLGYTAYVLGQEDNTVSTDITTSIANGSTTFSPVNSGGTTPGGDPIYGVTINITDQVGAEDAATRLPVSVTLTDPSEQLVSLTLSNVPNGVLVFSGSGAPGSLAINLGEMAGNPGFSTWGIPLLAGAVPAYIALQTPSNWSGVISDLAFGVWSGEAGLDPTLSSSTFDVTINGIADGIRLTPTLSFGNAGEIVPINLNSSIADHDGSELTTLSVKNLGAHASFYSGSTLLDATYDLPSDTYTLSGLTPADVTTLGVIQKGGTYNLQVTAFTTDSPGSNQSASVSSSLQLNMTSLGTGSSLLGDNNDNVLLGTGQNDSLTGGVGSDTLTGGLGADLFIWRSTDKPLLLGATDQDVIKDFKPSEGDRIDLSALLIGESAGTIDNFLRVDIATSTLQISSSGQFGTGGSADVTIKLENAGAPLDLSSYGISSSAIVNSLIAGADPLVKVD